MTAVLRAIVVLLRLALLGLPIYLICRCHLWLGLGTLIVSYPLWEVLIYELRLLRPNWRKAKLGQYAVLALGKIEGLTAEHLKVLEATALATNSYAAEEAAELFKRLAGRPAQSDGPG